MPRYFFDTLDGDCDIDHQGAELPDDATAAREAVRFLGGLLSDQPDLLESAPTLTITARSDRDAVVAKVSVVITTRPAL